MPSGGGHTISAGARGRLIGCTKGGLNSKRHAFTNAVDWPIRMVLSGGQTNDCIGARAMVSGLPKAECLLVGRGYNADGIRNMLKAMGIATCLPSHRGREATIAHNPDLYRKRQRI